jgi:hypothetical protein
MTTRLSPVIITFVVKMEVIMLLRNVGICLQDDMVSWITRPSQLPPCGIQMSSISICKDTKGTTNRLVWVDWGMVYLIRPFIHSFIHSQALIVQDSPLASLFRGFLITHIQIHGRTPLDEWSARRRDLYLRRTTQHVDTTEKRPCLERDSNPQSSGRRPTPWTTLPVGSAFRHLLEQKYKKELI